MVRGEVSGWVGLPPHFLCPSAGFIDMTLVLGWDSVVGCGETTARCPTCCPLSGTRLDRVLTRVLWCEGRFLVERYSLSLALRHPRRRMVFGVWDLFVIV